MKKETERRMCWNCEGYVSVHLTQCPYCRSFLQDPIISNDHSNQDFQSNTNMFSSSHVESENLHFSENSAWEKKSQLINDNPEKQLIFDLIIKNASKMFLFLGIAIFLFGLSIILFGSDNGLTLHWSKKCAHTFVLASLPLIYWSYKSISSSS